MKGAGVSRRVQRRLGYVSMRVQVRASNDETRSSAIWAIADELAE